MREFILREIELRHNIEKISKQISKLSSEIESLIIQEEEAYENLPKSLQASKRGKRMDENVGSLYQALGNLATTTDNIYYSTTEDIHHTVDRQERSGLENRVEENCIKLNDLPF